MSIILEKQIWSLDDLNEMGWHDSTLYAIATLYDQEKVTQQLSFDIDYIFKWVDPVAPSKFFTFYVAPCTLTFDDVEDLKN